MRQFLDRLYHLSGVLSGCLILAICLLVSCQILLNATSRIIGPVLPTTIPSYADFSGFMLAAASFLALAHTLRSGGHIRVNLVTQQFSTRMRVVFEFITLVLSTGLIGYALWYMVLLVEESHRYGDQSSGIIAIPLAIPQAAVAVGLAILFIALVDTLVELLRFCKPVLTSPDEV